MKHTIKPLIVGNSRENIIWKKCKTANVLWTFVRLSILCLLVFVSPFIARWLFPFYHPLLHYRSRVVCLVQCVRVKSWRVIMSFCTICFFDLLLTRSRDPLFCPIRGFDLISLRALRYAFRATWNLRFSMFFGFIVFYLEFHKINLLNCVLNRTHWKNHLINLLKSRSQLNSVAVDLLIYAIIFFFCFCSCG